MSDQIDTSDLEMIKAAADALREPQAVFAFVQQQMARKYALTAADRVNLETGAIERAPVAGAAPPSE